MSHDLGAGSHTGYGGEIFHQTANTGQDGRFRLDHVYPRTFLLGAGKAPKAWIRTRIGKRWYEEPFDEIKPARGAKEVSVRIVLAPAPPYRYHGRVTDASGAPVPGVEVSIGISDHSKPRTCWDNHHSEHATTGPDGTYDIRLASRFVRGFAVQKDGYIRLDRWPMIKESERKCSPQENMISGSSQAPESCWRQRLPAEVKLSTANKPSLLMPDPPRVPMPWSFHPLYAVAVSLSLWVGSYKRSSNKCFINIMLTLEQAKAKVVESLKEADANHNCIVIDEFTEIYPFGWIFFYQSREFVETGREEFELFGNAPYLVDAMTGAVFVTGTGRPISYYVTNYQLRGDPHCAHPLQPVRDLIKCLLGWIGCYRSN
ncbi:MAG: YrhB domain-containing protein [Verrucomicrobiota bacterium]